MSYKLRISKPGYNVLTETDLDNIIYDSEYDTLKYHVSGVLSIVVNEAAADPAYNYQTAFSHNLGYYPFYEVFVNHLTNWQMIGSSYVTAGYGSGSGVYRKFTAYVTTTQLGVVVDGDTDGVADSYTASFRYKIYRNNLGL